MSFSPPLGMKITLNHKTPPAAWYVPTGLGTYLWFSPDAEWYHLALVEAWRATIHPHRVTWKGWQLLIAHFNRYSFKISAGLSQKSFWVPLSCLFGLYRVVAIRTIRASNYYISWNWLLTIFTLVFSILPLVIYLSLPESQIRSFLWQYCITI